MTKPCPLEGEGLIYVASIFSGVEIIYWLVETVMEIDLSPLQPLKRHGRRSVLSPVDRQQEYISHRWHTRFQLWRTATEMSITLISFATSSDHHSQATWRNIHWSLFSPFDTSMGALVWNRKFSTHSSKIVLHAMCLFKAQLVFIILCLGNNCQLLLQSFLWVVAARSN